jgi:hypothetical protein
MLPKLREAGSFVTQMHSGTQRQFISPIAIVLLSAALIISTFTPVYAQEADAAPPAQPSNSGSHEYTVAGTVINSVTGEAIGRAVAEILGPVNRATMTDTSGHFEFNSLAEGSVSVVVAKPGFFDEQVTARGQQLAVKVGPNAAPVVLRMIPANFIIGRVTTQEGEPLEGFLVRAISKQNIAGQQMWRDHIAQSQTLEDGSYRIADVPPGTYYLAVDQSHETTLSQPGVSNPREQGYAQVFYPGVTELGTAAPIELRGGQEVEANFALTAEPFYRIAGFVTGQDQLPSEIVFERAASDFTYNAAVQDGKFHIEIPAGSYGVHGTVPDRLLSVAGTIDVSSDTSDVRISLVPLPSIPVIVRTEFDRGGIEQADTAEAFQMVGVGLHSVSSTPSLKRTWIWWNPRSIEVQNVEPGVYQAELNTFGQWRVESARCGNVDLLSQDLTLTAGSQPSPIEITLRNDAATVSGTVREAEGELASVLLVQRHGNRNTVKLLTGVQGTFQFNGLAPGDYALIVSDGIEKMEYMNPEVLAPYLSTAAYISLQPHGTANVSLSLSPGNR